MTGDAAVGKPIPPEDTVRKVTGTAHYTFDWEDPGTLYANFAASTVPHAKILDINLEKAKEVPGVVEILTGLDMPFRV